MPRITRYLPLVTLAGVLALDAGCGAKKQPETDLAASEQPVTANPKQSFRNGVEIITNGEASGSIDYQAALIQFENATDTDPSFAKAHMNAGWCAEHLGLLEKAEEHYRQAVANAEGYTAALLNLANILTQQGQAEEAISFYKNYIETNPDDISVRVNLVNSLIDAQRYDDAELEAREILSRDKNNISAYTALARLYFQQGKYQMSLLCAEKSRTLDESDPDIYNAMGVTYLQMGDEPKAITQFKQAITLNPRHQNANMNLGWLALNSGDYKLANRCFQTVTGEYPGNIDALLGLAISQRGIKDLKAASATYDKIIELDPNNEIAFFNAATLHEKYTKNYKKALEYLQSYADLMQGRIGPTHEVFTRMERVRESQEEEEARKRALAQKKKEEEERKKRQKAQFQELKTRTSALDSLLSKYSSCQAMIDSGNLELAMTVVEQAKMVIEANDISMAADVMTFFDQVQPEIEAIAPSCQEEPAPTETESSEQADSEPADAQQPATEGETAASGDASDAPAPDEGSTGTETSN